MGVKCINKMLNATFDKLRYYLVLLNLISMCFGTTFMEDMYDVSANKN